jgi:predicted RNA binding protein YcfA (HicA-like mRNA interferase family)
MMNWNLTSGSIIQALNKDGGFPIRTQGDHWQFKHVTKKGKVTVPHPQQFLGIKTIKSILKQAALSYEEFEKCLK